MAAAISPRATTSSGPRVRSTRARIESYNKAREQCRANEYFETWKAVLDKQIAIYAEAAMDREVRVLEDERRMVEQLERGSPRRSA